MSRVPLAVLGLALAIGLSLPVSVFADEDAGEKVEVGQTWSGGCRHGQTRHPETAYHRVTSVEEWKRLWRSHGGEGEAPEVDFEERMVLALFFDPCGWTRQGHHVGHSLESARLVDGEMRVRIAIEISGARYACRKPRGFWFGVFEKRDEPVVVVAGWEAWGRRGEKELARIEAAG